MTGGASYTVSLPKDWVKEQGLKAGDVVAVMPRSDSSLTLMPHEKLPTGQSKGAEVTVTPQRDQVRELGNYRRVEGRADSPMLVELRRPSCA